MAAIADESVASTSQSNASDFDQTDVDKLMATGKKLYTTKDIQGACDIFGDICAKLAERFGQTADECGEAYLCYGKCLLEIARSESDVLGSSVSKVEASTSQVKSSSEESEGERNEKGQLQTEENGIKENGHQEKVDEDVENESGPEDGENEKNEVNVESEEKESEDDDNITESEEKGVSDDNRKEKLEGEEAVESEKQTSEDEAVEGGDEEVGDEEGDGKDGGVEEGDGEENNDEDEDEKQEEVSTMQQAWEILELCRIVFARHDTKEHKLKQAEANLLLGEIGMEQEHYPEAVGDFMECLRIQERFLESDDRLLAVTFYNLGLAYSFDRHYGKAIEYFSKAVDVIKLRIDSINKDSDESSKSSELKELQELLPEMLAKIEDAEYMKKSTEEIVRSAALMAKESLESSSFDEPMMDTKEGETEKKVNNITNLVRKKRKTDDKESETVCKKAKEIEQEDQ